MTSQRSSILWFAALLACAPQLAIVQAGSPAIDLPSGKQLLPDSLASAQRTNSLPTASVISPDGRWLVLLCNGYGTRESHFAQSLAVVNVRTDQLTDFPDARLGFTDEKQTRRGKQTYFLGLAFSPDGKKLYASIASLEDPLGQKPGNVGNGIAVYAFENGVPKPEAFFPIPLQKLADSKQRASAFSKLPRGMAVSYPAGLACFQTREGLRLLVADNLSDDALLLDAVTGKVLHRFDLSNNRYVPAAYPYGVAVSKDGSRAWVSLWNASSVVELDLKAERLARTIDLSRPSAASAHSAAMALSPDETRLFVCLANRDQVAVIDTASGAVTGSIDTKLTDEKYQGTFPDALAISPDGERLFVALASADAVAVVPLSAKGPLSPAGYIPTEWYPTALAVRGNILFVATGKGRGSGPNGAVASTPGSGSSNHPYIGTLLYGSISRVRLPDALRNLTALTKQSEQANRLREKPGAFAFRTANGKNPIKHVIYIIKENRTYDQVFGDLKVGNGDPKLCMFGEDITPNHHALARQFGVLDNFYASGDVSGNGHNWSMSAITSDYLEKTWQITYRNGQRSFDYEGEVANDYPILLGIPDINEPDSGYLWSNAETHRVSHRNYGEFVHTKWLQTEEVKNAPQSERAAGVAAARSHISKGDPLPAGLGDPPGGPSPWPWKVPVMERDIPSKPELVGHFDPKYPDFNLKYPDQLRVDEFLNEFRGFVEARGKPGELPQLVIMRLGNDHTIGTSANAPTPAAMLADNDLAVGRVVEAISHSPYWEDTAIFVVEDDAQDGADHVDAHRTVALAISKYSPGSPEQPFVDSHFYTTVSMVHTIEELVGLPPMNQNDAFAPLLAPLFSGTGDQPAFSAIATNRDNGLVYQMNLPKAPGAKQSAALDFSREDVADTAVLNRILWRDRMGHAPMPKPIHRFAFQDNDDD